VWMSLVPSSSSTWSNTKACPSLAHKKQNQSIMKLDSPSIWLVHFVFCAYYLWLSKLGQEGMS
jgi:hypothetical protein